MYITEVKTRSCTGKISHRCILLRESYREGGKVKNRTIANLTHCKPEEINALRWALKNKGQLKRAAEQAHAGSFKQGPSIGAVWALHHAAGELGIVQALGSSREGKLALWQVMARVIGQGSRLSAVRLAQEHAAGDVFGLRTEFDENDLYDNLKWLSQHQQTIEDRLFRHRYPAPAKPSLFLYDVTNTYLEDTQNIRAAFGYNRDKKNGKKQLVISLLCDADGEALSIEVFKGNTSDIQTSGAQSVQVADRFGGGEITRVGERGMIKAPQQTDLKNQQMHYITALTQTQIRALLKRQIFMMDLFDETIAEVYEQETEKRYVLRRNPQRAKEIHQNRQEKKAHLQAWLSKKNIYLSTHPTAKMECAYTQACEKIENLKLSAWVSVSKEGRRLSLAVDAEALQEEEKLDGCYALVTNLKPAAAPAKIIHDRYKDLARVERAFRISETSLLEMCPVYVRNEQSTRGHALVVMLALRIITHLQKAWAPCNMTVEEALHALAQYCAMEYTNDASKPCCCLQPRDSLRSLFEAIHTKLPDFPPRTNARVVTRKKRTRMMEKPKK